MKFAEYNYKERLIDFIFERNWIELPLFWNNKTDEVMRLGFESNLETTCANTIKEIFDDVFYQDSEMLIVFYSIKGLKGFSGKNRYFKIFRTKKIFKQNYISRDDNIDSVLDKPYVTAYKTNRKYFNLDRYIADYLRDEQQVNMSIISLKKGVAIQLYDCRGMDVVVNDAIFLEKLKCKYLKYLMPNR